jgi:hypothetical protein
MRIAVLGPLEVVTDSGVPVAVPGTTERLLLAVLAAAAPHPVSTDALLALLPDGEADAESLRTHLGRLRGALQPGLPERSSGQYVLHRGTGYSLVLGRSDIDAARFETLVAQARGDLAAGEPTEAVRLLTTALGLWRGRPYDDWPQAGFAEDARRRLTGLHAEATALLTDARRQQADAGPRAPASVPLYRPPASTPLEPVRPARPLRERHPVERHPVEPHPVDPSTVTDAVDTSPEPVGTPARTRRVALVAVLLVALVVAAVAILVQWNDQDAPSAASAPTDIGSGRAPTIVDRQDPVDISLLLAVAAVRADSSVDNRRRLLSVLGDLGRAEHVVPFPGLPHDPVLSDGKVLTFRNDRTLLELTSGRAPEARVLLPVPGEWGAWLVTAPSPTAPVIVAAGENLDGPWLRTISTADGTSRLLLAGDRLVGRPVDAVVTPDGRRVLLLVAERSDNARWRVIDVDLADGSPRDTGLRGVLPAATDALDADFSDDGRTVVVWDVTQAAPATLVDIRTGRRTAVTPHPRPAGIAGYVAVSNGAVQLWDDGAVSRIDGNGINVQDLIFHVGQVRDVVVPPDGDWAVTAGDVGWVVRWDVDPASGIWRHPERMNGHGGAVVGVAAEPDGGRLFSVSLDDRVISWDMRDLPALGGIREERARRFPFMDAADEIQEACAVAGRDLTQAEWKTYLPGRAYRPTCSDLS